MRGGLRGGVNMTRRLLGIQSSTTYLRLVSCPSQHHPGRDKGSPWLTEAGEPKDNHIAVAEECVGENQRNETSRFADTMLVQA